MTLTPGAYLKRRRKAAQMSIADVATVFATEPRWGEHMRIEWIAQIEADAMPASFNTIVALRCAFQFDIQVLASLAAIALGVPIAAPIICRICACSEQDACGTGRDRCGWVDHETCSRCAAFASVQAKQVAA